MAKALVKSSQRGPSTPADHWITMGQACEFLGVNETTLRRWSDAGQIQTFRTPGGHRRFSKKDLLSLMSGEAAPKSPYNSLGQITVKRIRRRLHRGNEQSSHWYMSLNEDDKNRLRPLGRRLAELVGDYLTARSRRSPLLKEAKEIGKEYGTTLMNENLSLRDALEAFTFFRKNLDDAAIELAQRSSLSSEQTIEMWEVLSDLADQMLLSITEAYAKSEIKSN